ncbi:histidine phosphatase family protein [Aphanothece hegewaldii CCALA 016]|uniref:Histidine phosphatase family protein n=1 Tax=Aphanothece hegewaldii CCALA 016 TaxID=2107694 RepID=A0A2T1M235_9CHRO|nr:histidine phosphatase family protein [Aphanothece hegewaldii]PSF38758.1 histidine phosphatase family protein [Aphanothece hegewaldii CCALA 016]
MTTRVIIVRHGQSNFNALQKIQGRSDLSVLTETGQNDAEKVGKALKDINIDAIYCSPLQRAKTTAQIIQSCLVNPTEINVNNQLIEVDLPLWENLSKDEVKEKFPDDYRCWHKTPQEFKMILDGEKEHYPLLSLYQQAKNFWSDILAKHDNQTILIVGHNGINRCLILTALGMHPAKYHALHQSNCCINVLNFVGGLGDTVQIESLNQTAHLGVSLPSSRPSQKGIRLLLVRHGETQWNREGRFQGIRDIPLNENGKNQAQKAADFLKDVNLNFAVSSPLARPKETAEIILQYHPEISLDFQPDLTEICHGLWEGKLETEIEAGFPGLLQQWKTQPETVQMPEGENLQQVWDRAIACWNNIVKIYGDSEQHKVGIVVAHDAINKVILCYLLGLKPDNFWNVKQGNGAVSVIDYLDGIDSQPLIQAVNLTSHLGGGVLDKTAAGAL